MDVPVRSPMIWVFAALVAAPYVFYVLQVGRRRKEYLTFRLRRLGVALVLYFVSVAILAHIGYGPIEAIVFGVICGIAGGCWFVGPPKRSRKNSASHQTCRHSERLERVAV